MPLAEMPTRIDPPQIAASAAVAHTPAIDDATCGSPVSAAKRPHWRQSSAAGRKSAAQMQAYPSALPESGPPLSDRR
jgi:hypothetical protein